MFKLTFLIKAYNLIVIDCTIDFILQVFDRSNTFFAIISNALNRLSIDNMGISIHYTFFNWMHGSGWKFETSLHFVPNARAQAAFEHVSAAAWATPVSRISIPFCLRFMRVNINAGLPRYCGNSCNIYRL